MKAISLHQPWASLCVTRKPCDCRAPEVGCHHSTCARGTTVKTLETRSWPCPPNLIGQRIALHATVKPPKDFTRIGDYEVVELANGSRFMVCGAARFDRSQHIPLPLGAIVGSARIEACGIITTQEAVEDDTAPLDWLVKVYAGGAAYRIPAGIRTCVADLPYGDFTPGRYAWLLTDAAPVQERCPWCDGGGETVDDIEMYGRTETRHYRCPVCDGAGRCDPIPARGHQRVWNWTP